MRLPSCFLFCLLMLATAAARAGDWREDFAALLKQYATPEGVHYAAWKSDATDLASLQRVTDAIGESTDDDLAFYLNAYNANILREALAKYPTATLHDGDGNFYREPSLTVGGKRMSFDALEDDIIRPRFKEPQMHFALANGSKGGPRLYGRPFESRTVGSLLTILTGRFVNDHNHVRYEGGKAMLSKIFEWRRTDFPEEPLAFLRPYMAHHFPDRAPVGYLEYDWSLNEAK